MTTPNSNPHDAAVRRACLPEILLVSDLALALQVSEHEASRLLLSGACGPYFRLAGRLAIRRDALLAALADRERHMLPPVDPDTDDGVDR